MGCLKSAITMEARFEYFKHTLSRMHAAAVESRDKLLEVSAEISDEMDQLGYSLDSLLLFKSKSAPRRDLRVTNAFRTSVVSNLRESTVYYASGDGNCFFHSLSSLLCGSECLCHELRLRTGLCMTLNPERIIVAPENQFVPVCERYPNRIGGLLHFLMNSCPHNCAENLHSMYVNQSTLELLNQKDDHTQQGFMMVPPDVYWDWLEAEQKVIFENKEWTCYGWIIAASAALELEIYIVRSPGENHSIAITPNRYPAREQLMVYWQGSHFMPVQLSGDGKRFLDSIHTRQMALHPFQFTDSTRVICLCDAIHGPPPFVISPLKGVFALDESVLECDDSNGQTGRKRNDKPDTPPTKSKMPSKKLSNGHGCQVKRTASGEPEAKTRTEHKRQHSGEDAGKDQESPEEFFPRLKIIKVLPGEFKCEAVSTVGIHDQARFMIEEEKRVLGVITELHREKTESTKFSIAGYTSFSTQETIKRITLAIRDSEMVLSRLDKFLLRKRTRLFFFQTRSPENYRFRLDVDGNLYYRTTKTTERRFVCFPEAFGILWKSHLSPSLSCRPKRYKALAKEFSAYYYFGSSRPLAKEIKEICKGCQITRQLKSALPSIPQIIRGTEIMERIQCDLIDMAPDSILAMRDNFGEYRYILSVTEFLTRYCFLFPLRTKTAKEMIKTVQWFLITEGCPRLFHTDNGTEFKNAIIKKLLEISDTKFIHGAPYHPESQGQVEKLNGKIKRAFAHLLVNVDPLVQGLVWPYLLPVVQRMLNTSIHCSTGCTPFEFFKGYSPLPDDGILGVELDSVQCMIYHGEMMESLAPEDFDDEEPSPKEEEQDAEELTEKARRHILHLDKLPEPARSLALVGMEQLSHQRACMRGEARECIERRLYQNVYKAAVKARQVKIEPGDVMLWKRVVKKRPKSSINITVKIVRIVDKKWTFPEKFKVEYFGTGSLEPPMRSDINEKLFSEIVVQGRELCLLKKNHDAVTVVLPITTEADDACVPQEKLTKTAVSSVVTEFSERVRQFLKENHYFAKKPSGEMATPEDLQKYFEILDQGTAGYITGADKSASIFETCVDDLTALKNNGRFTSWLSSLYRWECLSAKNPFKIQNILAKGDFFHKGSCIECMASDPGCKHVCCTEFFTVLCEKRGATCIP